LSARREFEIGGKRYAAMISRNAAGLVLEIDGRRIEAALEPLRPHAYRLTVGGKSVRIAMAADAERTYVQIPGRTFEVLRIDPDEALASGVAGASHDVAAAPMPGTVVSIHVKPGDRVVVGQPLMIIESMKLETAIAAWRDGVVKQVHLAPGATFALKTALITLESTN
jgi:3-methylcrotonyl-CoA carboxylase alpha subunit